MLLLRNKLHGLNVKLKDSAADGTGREQARVLLFWITCYATSGV